MLNGKIVETEEIIRVDDSEQEENEVLTEGRDALSAFFSGLASSDTNSIAKIRALAKTFLENSGEG